MRLKVAQVICTENHSRAEFALDDKGFVRIRHFGFLASRRRAQLLPLCVAALDSPQIETATPTAQHLSPNWFCPKCGGPMVVIDKLTTAQIHLRSPPKVSIAAA
jgi:hypothetical protein